MNRMINDITKDVDMLECHPLTWWFHLVFFMIAGMCMIVITIISNELIIMHVMFICFSIITIYFALSMPRRIIFNNEYVCLNWPWFTWQIPVEDILRINVKEYRLKVVFISIIRKDSFINLPIPFDWSLQKINYENVLAEIMRKFKKG